MQTICQPYSINSLPSLYFWVHFRTSFLPLGVALGSAEGLTALLLGLQTQVPVCKACIAGSQLSGLEKNYTDSKSASLLCLVKSFNMGLYIKIVIYDGFINVC